MTARSPNVWASTAGVLVTRSRGGSTALACGAAGSGEGVGSSGSATGGETIDGRDATTGSIPSMDEMACRSSAREPAGQPRRATTIACGDRPASACSPKQ